MAPASSSKCSILLMHIHKWAFLSLFFFPLSCFIFSGLKTCVLPGANWVRNAALGWIKDVTKQLPLPSMQTGTEQHLPGDLTWAAGSQSRSPSPHAGRAVGAHKEMVKDGTGTWAPLIAPAHSSSRLVCSDCLLISCWIAILLPGASW